MSLRYLAPAGTRIGAGDLLAWLGRSLLGHDGAADLTEAVKQRYGIKELWLISSGRAAMTLILRTLRQQAGPDRDEVIVPAYTCYSVGASAILAGLKVRPVDIDPETLSYQPEALAEQDFSRVLVVVSGNLYGIPNDLPAIETLCRERCVYLIDDAAQSLHAQVGGRYAGTFGDVGIYSLDKGKNLTSIQGGMIVSNRPELVGPLTEAVASLPAAPLSQTAKESVKLLAYAVLLRPWLYWLPQRAVTLGETIYETDFPQTRYSPSLGNMAARLFRRVDAITGQRQDRARRLIDGLQGSDWRVPHNPCSVAVYPRLPLLAPSADQRHRALVALNHAGIGATGSYPLALPDVPEIQSHLANAGETPQARRVANTILTLPTHSYVSMLDVQRMLELLLHNM